MAAGPEMANLRSFFNFAIFGYFNVCSIIVCTLFVEIDVVYVIKSNCSNDTNYITKTKWKAHTTNAKSNIQM